MIRSLELFVLASGVFLDSTYAPIAAAVISSGSDGRLNTGHGKLFHPRLLLSLSCLHLFSRFSNSLISSSRESIFPIFAWCSPSNRSCSRLNCSRCCRARFSARRAHSASSNLDAYGDVAGAGLVFVGDGLGVVEKGIEDDVKEELVACELFRERPDHVEFAKLLKVEGARLRSAAEPVVKLGRCGGGESNAAPMLF